MQPEDGPEPFLVHFPMLHKPAGDLLHGARVSLEHRRRFLEDRHHHALLVDAVLGGDRTAQDFGHSDLVEAATEPEVFVKKHFRDNIRSVLSASSWSR